MPALAPLPTPTIMAVGVASPKAHGQAMTSTATKEMSPRDGEPAISHNTKASTAIPNTMGTNTEEILSASACIGALDPCASSTMRTILASIVSDPTRVALKTNEPLVLSVPATTVAPRDLLTGMGSPVIIDSST